MLRCIVSSILCACSLAGTPPAPPSTPAVPLALDLPYGMQEKVPAQVISPIFRSYVAPQAGPRASLRSDPAELEKELLARQLEQQARLYDSDSALCLNRAGGDSTGGGVRWSLNDGFGFYVQGRGFKHLQRLLKHNDVSGVCAPGDPSPMCRHMPRQTCD